MSCPSQKRSLPDATDAHPQVTNVASASACPSFATTCPFSSAGSHPDILSPEALEDLKKQCPAWSNSEAPGTCPFSEANPSHPTVRSPALAQLCPAFKEACPFSSSKAVDAQHPSIDTVITGDVSKCPAFSRTCSFSISAAHPDVDKLDSVKACPAFEVDCPFKPNSNQNVHKRVRFSEEAVAYIKSVCPEFAKATKCPFADMTNLDEMNLAKCPAFSASCPFDIAKSKYPQFAELFNDKNIAKCKAFMASKKCPFNAAKSRIVQESCPFLASWHKTHHPGIRSMDDAVLDCVAFQQQAGCPFRDASSDERHRLLGLSPESMAVIKEKCPAWSHGICPFSKKSTAHPDITKASNISSCPVFQPKTTRVGASSCPFNRTSETNKWHPNVGDLFTRSVKECVAFAHGCPFQNLGSNQISTSKAEIDSAIAKCPAFIESNGCPFKQVTTSADLFSKFAEIPSSHLALITTAASSRMTVPKGHPTVPSGASDSEQIPAGCPASKKRKADFSPHSSSVSFAKMFGSIHFKSTSHAGMEKCPAFKGGCAFEESVSHFSTATSKSQVLTNKTPLQELLKQCPAFQNGKCPFAA